MGEIFVTPLCSNLKGFAEPEIRHLARQAGAHRNLASPTTSPHSSPTTKPTPAPTPLMAEAQLTRTEGRGARTARASPFGQGTRRHHTLIGADGTMSVADPPLGDRQPPPPTRRQNRAAARAASHAATNSWDRHETANMRAALLVARELLRCRLLDAGHDALLLRMAELLDAAATGAEPFCFRIMSPETGGRPDRARSPVWARPADHDLRGGCGVRSAEPCIRLHPAATGPPASRRRPWRRSIRVRSMGHTQCPTPPDIDGRGLGTAGTGTWPCTPGHQLPAVATDGYGAGMKEERPPARAIAWAGAQAGRS